MGSDREFRQTSACNERWEGMGRGGKEGQEKEGKGERSGAFKHKQRSSQVDENNKTKGAGYAANMHSQQLWPGGDKLFARAAQRCKP
mmetsp:Transcript_71290/g.149030  ORF Transcript_71290/g.149030 Transcript_71290/m.149030 type:complete len:87 (-) Transcript_71290:34-294(-)